MRPIPISTEILAELNADEPDAGKWQKITLLPPDGVGELEDGTKCDPVEVVVETEIVELGDEDRARLAELVAAKGEPMPDEPIRSPRRFLARIAVTVDDIKALEESGAFWVSLWGQSMQPFAVFVDLYGEDDPRPVPTYRELFELVSDLAELEELEQDTETAMVNPAVFDTIPTINDLRRRALTLFGS